MRRVTSVLMVLAATVWPATAGAYLPTLTISEARAKVEEGNERAEEGADVEILLGRCHRVHRLRVDCRQRVYLASTGEPVDEMVDRVYVTPRNRLVDSPVIVRWFF